MLNSLRESFRVILLILVCLITPGPATNCFAQKVGDVKIHKVLDQDFPDPTVISVENMFYAYATESGDNSKHIRIQVASSTDHEHWKFEGEALTKPAWTADKSEFWAPDVFFDTHLQKYIMFFSADATDAPGKCIGVAFSNTPLGPFVANAKPLICGGGFKVIDPKGFTDPKTGKHFLYWGSDFQPIKVQEMADDWLGFKPGSAPVDIVWPGKDKTYSNLIEGAWLDYNNGYYYLYYSGDNCCGNNANYAVMVARAKHPDGPFIRFGEANKSYDSAILQKDSDYIAPGHNSVFTDSNGKKWIAYHAIEKQHKEKGRVMCINPLNYVGGWPVVISAF